MAVPSPEATEKELVYHDTFLKHPCALAPAMARVAQHDALDAGLEDIYPALLQEIARGRSGLSDEAALIFEWFRTAQNEFAVVDCVPAKNEGSLTGALQARLSSAARALQDRGRAHLWSVELILHGREQRLGGDLAFVIEADERFGACCFQAKRLTSKRLSKENWFNIEQPKIAWQLLCKEHWIGNKPTQVREEVDSRDWQLRRLSTLEEELRNAIPANAAYLFYDNQEKGTWNPVLPVAKRVGTISEDVRRLKLDAENPSATASSRLLRKRNAQPRKLPVRSRIETNLGEGLADLATYVADILSDEKMTGPATDESLAVLLKVFADEQWSDFMALSPNPEFPNRLRRAAELAMVEVDVIPLGMEAQRSDSPHAELDVAAAIRSYKGPLTPGD